MTRDNIKTQMMKLWKKVFKDSDEYISLIFNNYFDENLIEYEEQDGRIIAALLGIPYNFFLSEKHEQSGHENDNNIISSIKGLYLCGLATESKFRGRGIMKKLINRINSKAKILGYHFTFLIPASESLIEYYRNNNYVSCFKRVINRFVKNHIFVDKNININEDYNIIKYDSNNIENLFCKISNIYENIVSLEKCPTDINLIHSYKNIKNVIEENLQCNGEIFACYDNNSMLSGLALLTINDNNIVISNVYYRDVLIKKLILQNISVSHPELPITLYEFLNDNNRELLWSPFYTSYSPSDEGGLEVSDKNFTYIPSSHPEIYGMMRILNISEILKFVAKGWKNLKYSILVKGDDGEEDEFISIENGECSVYKIIRIEKEKILLRDVRTGKIISYNNSEYDRLTINQICEILFRNPSQEDYAGIAFGLPRVSFNMAYLFD